MTFKIEKGIPLPQSRTGSPTGECPYPFADMAVGDSFCIPTKDAHEQKIARQKCSTWAKRMRCRGFPGFRVSVRFLDSSVRVWRIDDGEPRTNKRKAPAAKLVAPPVAAPAPMLKVPITPDSYVYVEGKKKAIR